MLSLSAPSYNVISSMCLCVDSLREGCAEINEWPRDARQEDVQRRSGTLRVCELYMCLSPLTGCSAQSFVKLMPINKSMSLLQQEGDPVDSGTTAAKSGDAALSKPGNSTQPSNGSKAAEKK